MKKFMLIARDNELKDEFKDDSDREEFMKKFHAWTQDLIERKILIQADELSKPFKKVCKKTDETSISDGPFAETKETLTGYFLTQAENMDQILEITKSCPLLRFDNMEIYEIKGNN